MAINEEIINNINKLSNEQLSIIVKLEDWSLTNSELIKRIFEAHKTLKQDDKNVDTLIRLYAHLNSKHIIAILNNLKKDVPTFYSFVLKRINYNTKGDIFKLSLYNRIMTLNKIKVLPEIFSSDNLDILEKSLDKKNI